MATMKQVSYALALMDERGYPTEYMSRVHKDLGATMRERSGTVEGWVAGMSSREASRLIDRLLKLPKEG